MRNLVVTAGYDGYTRPYRDALGTSNFNYTCLTHEDQVPLLEWDTVFAVVFSGGADISPRFYNRTPLTGTACNDTHDALDHAMLRAVDDRPIYKLGTCRGAQLLWADSEKAQIVQHIPHHYRDHPAEILPGIRYTGLSDSEEAEVSSFDVNSLHHQACIWDSWESNGSSSRPPVLLLTGESHGQTSVEAWCNKSRGNLGFQYHPEWMESTSPAYQWTQNIIKEFVFGSQSNHPLRTGLSIFTHPGNRCDVSRQYLSDES